MTEFQDPFLKSGKPVKFPEKYVDNTVRPGDIGVADQWAVKPAADPCVGDLATPVNSGYFTKAWLNNLPFYRPGLSPNFRGLEIGAMFGYALYGPFAITGPFRSSDYALTAGLLSTIGAVHILTALLVLYNSPGKAPAVQPPDCTIDNPPADLFTKHGWADFTSGFWLGGCGGALFAWLLCGTLHLDALLRVPLSAWSVG
ncbi:photosystem I reaction center protein subunit XI [Prochlorococcus sp. MIT 1300]|uniref:photosystem I reaction center protein subunit XI n=1 Tax=Prochlorococcus sp. MIT 1300 TaxID=3096218 RepID=UPI002A7518AC|nr:photosystem I reaction center protein subunit XI [Prochlorococcus sp. MIT 1300]